MPTHEGSAASPGFGVGPAYVLSSAVPPVPDVDDPKSAFTDACAIAAAHIKESADAAAQKGLSDAAEILQAQAMMAEDPMLADEVVSRVDAGASLEAAIDAAADSVADALRASGSEYLAARAADIAEVARAIRFGLVGSAPPRLDAVPDSSVIVASELTAADTSVLDPSKVAAFATEHGGPTGHVAVIARALGIPAVVGVGGLVDAVTAGAEVLVDGGSGLVHVDVDAAARSEFMEAADAFARERAEAEQFHGAPVHVGDHHMLIAANVGSSDDVDGAVAAGADGIGLFRTEVLFLDTDTPPTEDAQVRVYADAASKFEHPVVVRMFDIGGDKPASYLDLPEEENPFLGVRGVRLFSDQRSLAMSQAKALLRAATSGDIWVMVPMVATVADVHGVHELFNAARAELGNEGVAFGDPPIGIMVETPAAAVHASALAPHVSFFSIGTNDLTQYTMAADRTHAVLAGYNDPAHPAVLRLCAMTAQAARDHGITSAVCGEAAADPVLATLFAAMGINELSMASPMINTVRKRLLGLDPGRADELLAAALATGSAAEVRALVADAVP